MIKRIPIAIARLGLMSGAFGLGSSAMVDAQPTGVTINNTAAIEWVAGSTTISELSNLVTIAVQALPPQSLQLYQFSTPPGTASFNVPTTTCQGSSGIKTEALGGVFAGTQIAPASLNPATSIQAGAPLVVVIRSTPDVHNSSIIETLTVKLTTASGDAETITLTETAPGNGNFVGMINTAAIPPTPVQGDCVLSVQPGDEISLTGTRVSDGSVIAVSKVNVLIDPYGTSFDSGNGAPVAGTRITLIDADTGLAAQVFGDDGVSAFPSTVTTGTTVMDGGGHQYVFSTGNYRFPFVKAGHYKLLVVPLAPYTAPSVATPQSLAGFTGPSGQPYTITDGSYEKIFTLSDPAPVRIDIPIDKAAVPLVITKTSSVQTAVTGDSVQYTVTIHNGDPARVTGGITLTDALPPAMRFLPNTVRINGIKSPYSVTSDGKTLIISAAALAPTMTDTITYVLQVRSDAPIGNTTNRAQAVDSFGDKSAVASAVVKIMRDGLSDTMTIIGRITDGGCTVNPENAKGVRGVRVMMEDGSYAVTDQDGRYHFDAVLPGTHVVQLDPSTFPENLVPTDCARNTRSAGSEISQFVSGGGGALLRVDFRGMTGENKTRVAPQTVARPLPPTDQDAAATDRDWVTGQAPGVEWLYPAINQNPRTKSVRVAIKHLPGQTVTLYANGKPVDPLSSEGDKKSGDGQIIVSLWNAIDLDGRDTLLSADVKDVTGKAVAHLSRNVHFASTAIHAELLRDKSVLVADGVNRPVIAVRLTDRDGRPIHHGQVGDFSVSAPYFPAVEADAETTRQLSGLDRGKPVWKVEGEDGIAYIELEPTTASGSMSVVLPFRDGETKVEQRVEAWLAPGNRPWTIVGLAEGTVGYNKIAQNMQDLASDGHTWQVDGRIALYVKGRVTGKWLMTMAYDSAKTTSNANYGSTIDPKAYYTVYGDSSERRFDASSVRKLYLKLERPEFYVMFGDYNTAITEPQLARYSRALNGLKTEYHNERVTATAFAARTPYSHRREEIQGNGLSGPYQLGVRNLVPNSETIVLEVRDRLHSEQVVSSQALVSNIDYSVDYTNGTLRFNTPILSRDSNLNPQFIVINYEVDGVAQTVTDAGGRITIINKKKTLKVGLTVLHDETDASKTNLGGIDVRYTPNASNEVRAEFAVSNTSLAQGSTSANAGTGVAWLVEAEHHSTKYDLLAYVRQVQLAFGVGQTNVGEAGTIKFGVQGTYRFTKKFSVSANVYEQDYTATGGQRDAVETKIDYKGRYFDTHLGINYVHDQLADGSTATSNIANIGVTKHLFNNKLELDGQAEFALGGQSSSADFPARQTFTARYSFNKNVTLVGTYEIATGKTVNARTARIGFDLKPWTGAKLTSSLNEQTTAEYGPRTFAAYGLAQALPIGKHVTVDFTLDGNKTLGGINPATVLNPAQPAASGGSLSNAGTITEDFTAVTAGATYRLDKFSVTGRAEYRAGQITDRYGLTLGAIRQLGEGQAYGGAFSFTKASQIGGATTQTTSLAISWANRPTHSRIAFFDKFELRSDEVLNAVAGQAGPIGGPLLTVSGNVKSKRVINSLSLNWSPTQKEDDEYLGRTEVSLFWGTRYVFDSYNGDDLTGWSNTIGTDIKFDLGKMVSVGGSGTIRENPGGRSFSYAGGPVVDLSLIKNSNISVGYNFIGYRDLDYQDARYTHSGPYISIKLKFDQTTLQGLGLLKR